MTRTFEGLVLRALWLILMNHFDVGQRELRFHRAKRLGRSMHAFEEATGNSNSFGIEVSDEFYQDAKL